MVPEVSCLHGNWEDGVCNCDSGYMTEFSDTELYPIYCSIKQTAFVLNLRRGYEPLDFLHYSTMSVIITFVFMDNVYCFTVNLIGDCCTAHWKFAGSSVLFVHITGCIFAQL